MARRRQAKQPATESVVVASADGNVTPPKKRKTAVAKPAAAEPAAVEPAAADEPRQIRSRQAKAAKRENEAVSEPASPPKKSRAKPKSAVADAKNDAKSRPKRQTKKESENAAMKDDAAEEVVEKKTRGGKATEKAGMKATMVKPKAKVPVARKQKTTVENGDPEKNVVDEGPTKRTTRRAKAVEEGADAPVQPPVRAAPRKRKNAPDAKVIREAQVAKDEEEEENEAKVAEASKQSRTRAKKVETDTREFLLKFPFHQIYRNILINCGYWQKAAMGEILFKSSNKFQRHSNEISQSNLRDSGLQYNSKY